MHGASMLYAISCSNCMQGHTDYIQKAHIDFFV